MSACSCNDLTFLWFSACWNPKVLTWLQFPTVQAEPQVTLRLQARAALGFGSLLQSPGCRTLSSPATVLTQRTVRFLTPSEPQEAEHDCHPPTHHLGITQCSGSHLQRTLHASCKGRRLRQTWQDSPCSYSVDVCHRVEWSDHTDSRPPHRHRHENTAPAAAAHLQDRNLLLTTPTNELQ